MKAARAPGSSASSQRTPSRSRHFMSRPGPSRAASSAAAQLGLAARRSRRRACARAPPRGRGRAPGSRHAGGDQVVAARSRARRGATRRRSRRATRRRAPARAPARPRSRASASATPSEGAGAVASASSAALAELAARRGQHAPPALGDVSPGRLLEHRDHAVDQLAGTLVEQRAAPTASSSSKPRGRRGSARELRQLGVAAIGRDGLEVGLAEQPLGLGLEREAEPGRVARGAQGPGRVVDEGALVQDAQQRRARGRRAPPWGSISRASPASGIAIALTVKSRRARSSSSAAGRTSGSAPGSGVGLGARRREVDLVVVEPDLRGAEALVRARLAARAPRRARPTSPSTTTSMSARPRGRAAGRGPRRRRGRPGSPRPPRGSARDPSGLPRRGLEIRAIAVVRPQAAFRGLS